MNRAEFHEAFQTPGPVVLPVIHVLDSTRTIQNVETLIQAGAKGCFLINHDFGIDPFLPIIRDTRAAFPDLWIGLNFLAVTGLKAFPILAELQADRCRIDAYWADDARIDERNESQPEAEAIIQARSGWDGLYFGGTAFKKQRPVADADLATSAAIAQHWMDVVTTSGPATGQEADDGKITTFRQAIGQTPLALASGITPDNAQRYRDVDCFMVATGINIPSDFYTIDPARLRQLLAVAKELGTELEQ